MQRWLTIQNELVAALQMPIDFLRHGNGSRGKRMSLSEHGFLSFLGRQELVCQSDPLLLGHAFLITHVVTNKRRAICTRRHTND